MRAFIAFSVAILFINSCYSQAGGGSSPTIFNGTGAFTRAYGLQPDVVDAMHRVSGLKFTNGKRVEGSAFYNEDFHLGYVRFFNDKIVTQVPLKYNDLNEELYFEDNAKELILQTAFKEFGFTIKNENSSREVMFRNGFPPTEEYSDKTFYEVLEGATPYILLKKTAKKVHEAKELNGMDFLRIKPTDYYYAFDAGTKQIVRIKNSIDGITDALPTQREKIEQFCKSFKLKCKTEKEMILLFSQL